MSKTAKSNNAAKTRVLSNASLYCCQCMRMHAQPIMPIEQLTHCEKREKHKMCSRCDF